MGGGDGGGWGVGVGHRGISGGDRDGWGGWDEDGAGMVEEADWATGGDSGVK